MIARERALKSKNVDRERKILMKAEKKDYLLIIDDS